MNSSITFKYRISKVETLDFNINTDVYQRGTPVKMNRGVAFSMCRMYFSNIKCRF